MNMIMQYDYKMEAKKMGQIAALLRLQMDLVREALQHVEEDHCDTNILKRYMEEAEENLRIISSAL